MEHQSRTVKMRTDCDCMVACLAMLLSTTYEKAAEFFPPRAVKHTGYRWEWLVPYLSANRIYLKWFPGESLGGVDWSEPAMLDVPSLTAPERGDHIIFWTGYKIIDPSPRSLVYTTIPGTINAVYQLKKRP